MSEFYPEPSPEPEPISETLDTNSNNRSNLNNFVNDISMDNTETTIMSSVTINNRIYHSTATEHNSTTACKASQLVNKNINIKN